MRCASRSHPCSPAAGHCRLVRSDRRADARRRLVAQRGQSVGGQGCEARPGRSRPRMRGRGRPVPDRASLHPHSSEWTPCRKPGRAIRSRSLGLHSVVAVRDHRRLLGDRPAEMSCASRMNWACVQASGVAENVGVPGAKPGLSRPGRWSSHTCSGSSAAGVGGRGIVASWSCSRRVRPAARSYSPRSPLSSGQPRPCVTKLSSGAAEDPRRRRWRSLAVAVEAGAVPVPAVRGAVRQLPVDHVQAVDDGRVVGRKHPEPDEFEEARVDDGALVGVARARCRRSSTSCPRFGWPSLVSRRK